ncbi:hypothetical protein HU200_028087 [Digitaria exilis]|uniref:Chaoptin n=1 Tax=Digitaria exilis TaxID=1010633 RepID=A0A835BWW1_9POAL|nr:hypothetical protein HU200_028087 [Digitaria exilis]
MTSLQFLDIARNSISGVLPNSMDHLTSLLYLDLSYNNITGPLPPFLGRFTSLINLYSLKQIFLSYNALKMEISSEWQPPFRLERAAFASYWFSSSFSRAWYLNISNNQVHGGLPANMESMSLQQLFLGSNQLSGPVVPMPMSLTILDLSRNYLSGYLS